ncbi:MAG: serine/threonine-protein kinase [Aggregatilineales bacterium]
MVTRMEDSIRQIGSYGLKSRIAQTTISGVYRAVREDSGEEVALRIMYNADTADVQNRFLQCAADIATLSHPALVPVLDYGSIDNVVYIAMALMTGDSLKARMDSRRITVNHERVLPISDLPSLGEVADFLDRIASGLDYLHEQDMVHYQIQPGNILFDAQGQPFISDTGLARILKIVFSLAETNAINTNMYASPEQWSGEAGDKATDQYSLACLVYELLTGRPLFQSNSIFQLMNMHMNEFMIPPHHVRPGIPADLTIVLIRALAKSPQERHGSVGDFAKAFRHAIRKYEAGSDAEPTGFFTCNPNVNTAQTYQAVVAISEFDMQSDLNLDKTLRNGGVATWHNESLRLGTLAWKTCLRQAVKNTGCLVVQLTENTMKSDWVTLMLEYARTFEKPVYALLIRGEMPEGESFATIIDARDDQTQATRTLIDTLKREVK